MRNVERLAKELLAKKNMSIEKLAANSGLTKSTVISIFKKNDAKVSQLEAISTVLGVPVSYFLEDTKGSINIVSQGVGHNQGLSNQAFGNIAECIERVRGLEREVELLREMNEMLKGRK